MTQKDYVTKPSENFAVREGQVGEFHPDLCRHMGLTHFAYGWSPIRHGDWDDAQWEAYQRGHKEGSAT